MTSSLFIASPEGDRRHSETHNYARTSWCRGFSAGGTTGVGLGRKMESRRLKADASLLIAFVFQAHLAAEQTVDDDEVDDGEHHTDAPPDEADSHAVLEAEALYMVRLFAGSTAGRTFG